MASTQTTSLVVLELKRDLVLRDGGQGERNLHEPCREQFEDTGKRTLPRSENDQFSLALLSSKWGTWCLVLGTWCLFEAISEHLLCDLYMSTCYAHSCPEEGSYYYSL